MKKTLLLLGACSVMTVAQAQIPANQSMGFVTKATATWCGPCGDWGWTTQEDIISDNASGSNPHGIVFAAYGDPGSKLYNKVADTLVKFNQSWPNWAFNNVQRTVFSSTGGIYSSTTRTNLKKAVDSFYAIAPTASTGLYYNISGSTMTIKTRTKFWKAGSGTYAVAVYLIEDSVFEYQNSNTPGNVYHHQVLRGSVTGSTFGDQIANGSVAMNNTYDKNYTFNITDATWNKARLRAITVLWKKSGSTWVVENANSMKTANSPGVGVGTVAVDQLVAYPNPATDRLHISGALTVTSDARISLLNAIGQTVYSKTVGYNGGQLAEDISLDGLSNGVYNLMIQAEGAQSTQKIVIAK